MDERKKEIRLLEERCQEKRALVEAARERLGAALLDRAEAGDEFAGAAALLEEKGGLDREAAGAREEILAIKAAADRIKKLDEEIRRLEQDQSGQNRELSLLHARIGELILQSGEYAAWTAPFQEQLDALVPKIRSLEERLGSLGEKSDNVFAWIGRSAQSMVLRSFLAKNRSNLERMYAAMGERFAGQDAGFADGTGDAGGAGTADAAAWDGGAGFADGTDGGAVHAAMGEVARSRVLQEATARELSLLREERRKLNAELAQGGGAVRKMQDLENAAVRAGEKLAALFRRLGKDIEEDPERFAPLPEAESLEQIRLLQDEITASENRIARLETAIALDAERENIEKMEKAVGEYRRRIRECEASITALEGRIALGNGRLEELMARLEEPAPAP